MLVHLTTLVHLLTTLVHLSTTLLQLVVTLFIVEVRNACEVSWLLADASTKEKQTILNGERAGFIGDWKLSKAVERTSGNLVEFIVGCICYVGC